MTCTQDKRRPSNLAFAQNRDRVRLCCRTGSKAEDMEVDGESRVVLVHDWLTGMRGGEKCLEVVCRRWPGAPLITLLHKEGAGRPIVERRPLRTSFLQHFPAADR